MGRKSIARYQVARNMEFIVWADTEAATLEGRVKAQISDELYQFFKVLEDATYRDPDERVTFWQTRFDEVFGDGPDWNIYNRADRLVEVKTQWTSGERVTLWSCGKHRIEVTEYGYDGGMQLMLVYRNGTPGKDARINAGHLNPLKGWRFTLKRRDYESWVVKVRKAIR